MVSNDMHEPQRAQETVSKHYKEPAFCKAASTREDGDFIKVCFGLWQRSLFLPPAEYQGKEASASREGLWLYTHQCLDDGSLISLCVPEYLPYFWQIDKASSGFASHIS